MSLSVKVKSFTIRKKKDGDIWKSNYRNITIIGIMISIVEKIISPGLEKNRENLNL